MSSTTLITKDGERLIATPKKKKMTKDRWTLLALASPFLLFFLAFNYLPLFGWSLSFFSYRPGLTFETMDFVGLQYFRWMFTTDWVDVSRVLTNTLAMSGLLLLCSPLPMFLAILLNEVRSTKYKRFIQTFTTLPNFVSWVIIFSLAFALFSTDGMINMIFYNGGIIDEPVKILDNRDIVWRFQTMLNIWKGTGWAAIIYIAAIAGIDQEQYEAAIVDGAGRFQRAIYITLPGLMPTFFTLFLLNMGWLLSAGEGLNQYLNFYNALVAPRIETLDYFVYRVGILSGAFSYATAVGMLRSVVSVLMLVIANYVSKAIRGTGLF